MNKTTLARLICAAVMAGALAGCGGSDKDKAPGGGSATGTLSDSPVAGVHYTTSSGVSGSTNSNGQFQYNPGDTVTFKIGGLTLGQAVASGSQATITPLQLAQAASQLSAEQQQNMVTNLLVLLQSLDSDGDASNGINIPAAVGTALSSAVAAALNLSEEAATFAQSSALSGLVSTAGGSLVSPEEALAHFETQFLQDLAGVYSLDLGDNEFIAFRFNSDGSYIMGEVSEDDDTGQSGIERGRLHWDPRTGEISTSEVTLDTNGEWGLSHIQNERLFFALNGDTLLVKVDFENPNEADEILAFPRLQQSSGIVGAWALQDGEDPARDLDRQQFLFLSNGKYLMLDPVGDDEYGENDPQCGWEGLEYGSYSLSNGVLSSSAIIEDTNDCAGLHDSDSAEYSSFSGVSINHTEGSLSSDGETLLLRINTQAPVAVEAR